SSSMALRRVIVRGYANMRKVLASLLACTAAALAGCAGGPNAETPAGVSLAGLWRRDPSLGADPQQVIAKMRAQALRLIARAGGGLDEAAHGGPPGGRGGAARTQSPDSNPALPADETP